MVVEAQGIPILSRISSHVRQLQPGEDFQFDQYFSDGLKPPTSNVHKSSPKGWSAMSGAWSPRRPSRHWTSTGVLVTPRPRRATQPLAGPEILVEVGGVSLGGLRLRGLGD